MTNSILVNSLFAGNSDWENKFRVVKKFLQGIFLCICLISLQRSPKMRAKDFKNFISILAVVNHQNWLDASPHLTLPRFQKVNLPRF